MISIMSTATATPPVLKKYRLPYSVAGVRSFLPMYYAVEAENVSLAAEKACAELRIIWTNKLGGHIDNPKTCANICVAFKESVDAEWQEVHENDYQI